MKSFVKFIGSVNCLSSLLSFPLGSHAFELLYDNEGRVKKILNLDINGQLFDATFHADTQFSGAGTDCQRADIFDTGVCSPVLAAIGRFGCGRRRQSAFVQRVMRLAHAAN